ncbi:MAG TPA: GrpB family protein [Nocardioides sp.]
MQRPTASRRPDVTDVELVGGIEKRDLVLADPDPAWAERFRTHERRIRAALDATARQVEHIGSTSVPGLAAKPIIDILICVDDITAEEDYLDPLLGAGYELRVREPGHRMVRTPERDVHVHILTSGAPEADDYLLLRDHLRQDAEDRDLYEQTKRSLVTQEWSDMNAYADAKTEVITAIKDRARKAR